MAEKMSPEIDYTYWKIEHKSILERLPEKNIFMLFSGGKDSSLCMDFISRAGEEFGFDFEAHAGAFPVHRYPDTEKKRIESYWTKRGVNITWHKLAETDDDIEKAVNPCLLCQKQRKKMLKTLLPELVDDWEKLVLIASYSMWDIVSYAIEHILGDIFSNSGKREDIKNNRFIETSQRFYPLLKMKEGYTVLRPLIKYNSNDILKLIRQTGIPTLSTPCKFGDFRPKRILEKYYEKMGIRFEYNHVFDFAKKTLNLPDISSFTSIEKEEYLLNVF